jgi:hypothetical protein
MTRIAAGIYTNEEPPRQLVYGVAQEVLAALPAEGAVSGPQRFTAPAVVFDPEALKRVATPRTGCSPIQPGWRRANLSREWQNAPCARPSRAGIPRRQRADGS